MKRQSTYRTTSTIPTEGWDPDVPFTLHHFTFPSVSDMEEDVCLFNKSLGLIGDVSMRDISEDACVYFCMFGDLGEREHLLPRRPRIGFFET